MRSASLRFALYAGLLLAAATLAAHGWCLADGSVLDDHWHQKGLREHGWSPPELLRTLVIEPADWMHTWWQDRPVRWEYFRPLFVLAMKFVYVVIGGSDPVALHAYSVLLHFTSACLVCALCRQLTGRRGWSIVGGLIFVVYEHAVVTVAWPSSLNVVQQTALSLAALLAYIRASKLSLNGALRAPADPSASVPSCLRASVPWMTLAIILSLLALLTRENALLLPLIFLAFDIAFGGWAHARRRRPVYALFTVIGAAFVIARVWLVTHPMPDVYIRRPAGDWPEYAAWCAAKLLHYVCTSIWFAPMTVGPTGRFNPWTESTGDCLLMLGIVIVIVAAYRLACRRVRGWWIWPLWILLSVLPVVPVIATPHSGYPAGVGFAIGCALVGASARGRHSVWARWASRTVPIVALGGMCAQTVLYRWQWTGMIGAERYATTWVAANSPAREVRDVFFVNLPFVNVYAKPQLVEILGPWFEAVNCHVLVYCPDPVLMEQPCTIRQLDAYSFAITVESQPYFSRLLGRFLIEAFRTGGRFGPGDRFETPCFDVQVLRADSEGVWELAFRFPRALNDPAYCFYMTTPSCGAAKVRFRGETELTGGSGEPGPMHDPARGVHVARLNDTTRALGAAEQRLSDNRHITPAQRERIYAWWRELVADPGRADAWCERFNALIELREEVPHARMHIGAFLRTDLYLTGPPFPGPR